MSTNEVSAPIPNVPDEASAPAPQVGEVEAVVIVTDGASPADQLAGALGRNWGILLALGIILTGIGAAVLIWPHASIGIIAVLLGIALLVSGIFSIVTAFTRSDHPTGLRVLGGITGVMSLVLGLFALSGITEAVWILALMVGFGWIVRGIAELAVGIGAKGKQGRGLAIAAGILAILAGGAVLFWPSITLVVLAYINGIALILLGIMQMVMAFRVRTVNTAQDLEQVLQA